MKLSKSILLSVLCLTPSATFAKPAYTLSAALALGTPDRWDYVVFDAATRRVYVAHGDRVTVVDPKSRTVAGQVEGVPGGTHGIAISPATGQGFTDDGTAGQAVVFDLKTLKVTRTIAAAADADAIAFDKSTGHVFVVEGDAKSVTIVDPGTDAAVATMPVGEKLEYAVTDDAGLVYVAGEEKGDLVKIDEQTHRVLAHFPAPGCVSPHGLAIDKARRRLFIGCANSVMVAMDADDGRVVASLPIGRGNDAMAYDPVRRRVFSSNGSDGTVSVFQQGGRDSYTALEPIQTAVSGRTMSLDPQTGRLFVAAASTDPNLKPGGRPRPRPGTLKLLMFDPAP